MSPLASLPRCLLVDLPYPLLNTTVALLVSNPSDLPRGTFTDKQVREIASPSLRTKSNNNELKDFDLDSVLPEAFTEDQNMGRMVKSWVSQVEVESQPSLTIHSPTSAPTFTPLSPSPPSWLPRIVEWHHEASGRSKLPILYEERRMHLLAILQISPSYEICHPSSSGFWRCRTVRGIGSADSAPSAVTSIRGVKYIFHPADEYKANGLPRRHVMAACRHGDECLNRTFCLFDHP
ncbi:hypothetical protein FNV43_RR26731 [Rhamnella rubrinervis]|uniref:C3H1-type domain-containing protein n=1 Tax=Rhamnella rubrinervis TaxID=2594499 RepID=A0A8K0GMS7_9ROSA|nr:hypothetical protein FNV43_RR26731 [Rhamnella rubrinervis]